MGRTGVRNALVRSLVAIRKGSSVVFASEALQTAYAFLIHSVGMQRFNRTQRTHDENMGGTEGEL